LEKRPAIDSHTSSLGIGVKAFSLVSAIRASDRRRADRIGNEKSCKRGMRPFLWSWIEIQEIDRVSIVAAAAAIATAIREMMPSADDALFRTSSDQPDSATKGGTLLAQLNWSKSFF
jgi:hypothetical protein